MRSNIQRPPIHISSSVNSLSLSLSHAHLFSPSLFVYTVSVYVRLFCFSYVFDVLLLLLFLLQQMQRKKNIDTVGIIVLSVSCDVQKSVGSTVFTDPSIAVAHRHTSTRRTQFYLACNVNSESMDRWNCAQQTGKMQRIYFNVFVCAIKTISIGYKSLELMLSFGVQLSSSFLYSQYK